MTLQLKGHDLPYLLSTTSEDKGSFKEITCLNTLTSFVDLSTEGGTKPPLGGLGLGCRSMPQVSQHQTEIKVGSTSASLIGG